MPHLHADSPEMQVRFPAGLIMTQVLRFGNEFDGEGWNDRPIIQSAREWYHRQRQVLRPYDSLPSGWSAGIGADL